MKNLYPILLACSIYSAPLFADLELGMKANREGDRVTAFKEFYASAHQEDNRAYGKLASMYLYGLGTLKNNILAYVWFHMAHLSGEKQAKRFRDAASSNMTRKEYTEAVTEAEKYRIKLGLDNISK